MSAAEQLHDPLPTEHFVRHVYQSQCSCGWHCGDEITREAADAALARHRSYHDEMNRRGL